MISATGSTATVAETLTPSEASGIAWHAIIIGGGPAGAATAWRLAARGLRTLLLDRHDFPRTKVCGSCLSARAIRELEALGPAALPEASVRLETVQLAHRGQSVRIPLAGGRVVSRECLDAHLVRGAIAQGCHWLPGIHVQAIDDTTHADAAWVTCAGGKEPRDQRSHCLRGSLVVVATGLADHVRIRSGHTENDHPSRSRTRPRVARSRIGTGGILPAGACDIPAGELVMVIGRQGYCGLVRLDDGRIDMAAALDPSVVACERSPARVVAGLLADAASFAAGRLPDSEAVLAASFYATPPLTRRAPLVDGVSRRVLRVGDAAGYVEPFTGEGIGWALGSARMLAAAVVASHGLHPPEVAAERYQKAHRHELAPSFSRCQLMARGLRHPMMVATTMTAARMLPWAARRLVPIVVGADPGGAIK